MRVNRAAVLTGPRSFAVQSQPLPDIQSSRVRVRLQCRGVCGSNGPRRVNMQLGNGRGLDVINAHERDSQVYVEGIRAAAEAVVAGRLDPTPLYPHRFALDGLPRALDAMRGREGEFLKHVVTYD